MVSKTTLDEQAGSERLILLDLFRRPDLKPLGNSVTSLPPSQWHEGMMFMGVLDRDLLMLTAGGFPRRLRPDRRSHPVFVLREQAVGPYVCPCTTKGTSWHYRYIKQGCRLHMSEHTTDCDSYLVESHGFTLPLDRRLSTKARFKGKVPAGCIIDKRGCNAA